MAGWKKISGLVASGERGSAGNCLNGISIALFMNDFAFIFTHIAVYRQVND